MAGRPSPLDLFPDEEPAPLAHEATLLPALADGEHDASAADFADSAADDVMEEPPAAPALLSSPRTSLAQPPADGSPLPLFDEAAGTMETVADDGTGMDTYVDAVAIAVAAVASPPTLHINLAAAAVVAADTAEASEPPPLSPETTDPPEPASPVTLTDTAPAELLDEAVASTSRAPSPPVMAGAGPAVAAESCIPVAASKRHLPPPPVNTAAAAAKHGASPQPSPARHATVDFPPVDVSAVHATDLSPVKAARVRVFRSGEGRSRVSATGRAGRLIFFPCAQEQRRALRRRQCRCPGPRRRRLFPRPGTMHVT